MESLLQRLCEKVKLTEGRFRQYIGKKFFMMRVVKHWNKFPREMVDASSLEIFKDRWKGP